MFPNTHHFCLKCFLIFLLDYCDISDRRKSGKFSFGNNCSDWSSSFISRWRNEIRSGYWFSTHDYQLSSVQSLRLNVDVLGNNCSDCPFVFWWSLYFGCILFCRKLYLYCWLLFLDSRLILGRQKKQLVQRLQARIPWGFLVLMISALFWRLSLRFYHLLPWRF